VPPYLNGSLARNGYRCGFLDGVLHLSAILPVLQPNNSIGGQPLQIFRFDRSAVSDNGSAAQVPAIKGYVFVNEATMAFFQGAVAGAQSDLMSRGRIL